ncbi:hypothetical protein MLD38_031172 [Melastoma candidum]|uniref:Uncharacterized protein n=1 Tax=Melastoma candidum TaxID=119954 RepID=A0ACB9MNX9_9MYRT|nr:hypothetical protein MLD38_031172 [Melastoma candidum]
MDLLFVMLIRRQRTHTVEFLEVAFGYVRLKRRDQVMIDKSKAKKVLGWKSEVRFEELVRMTVDKDIELAKREKVMVDEGYMDAR